jgi:FkbM family methyltransferase
MVLSTSSDAGKVPFLKLLAKMYLDRRPFRGSNEFTFRFRAPKRHTIEILISARDSDFQTTVKLRRDSSDLPTFDQVFLSNDYNLRRLRRWKEIQALYRTLADEGTPLILDMGANIGLASLYFAKNWPEAQIIAVEPSEANYRLMIENIARYRRIRSIQAGVASRDGMIAIENPDARACEYRTSLADAGRTGAITGLSVQSLIKFASHGPQLRPFIAKIDIEGFEDNLFSENTEWISLFPIIILEPHDWMFPKEGKSMNFLRSISKYNRDFVYANGNVFSIANDSKC